MELRDILEGNKDSFSDKLGIRMVSCDEGHAIGGLDTDPWHKNPIGSIHGGVIFTLADVIGGAAAITHGRIVTTLSGNINYLRPALDSNKLIGETREIKVGKDICVYEVVISDETDCVIATATMTYMFLEKNQ